MAESTFDYTPYIRELPGKNRCDLTKLLATPEVLARALEDLAAPFRDKAITKVAALDALGFALGRGVAQLLGAGLILLRKEHKVAWHVESTAFTDYSGEKKVLEIARDAVGVGDQVLVVDDWSETGTQLKAAIGLIEGRGASVIGASYINIEEGVWQNPSFSRYILHRILRDYP